MSDLAERICCHPFFKGLKPEHLTVLTYQAQERTFEPGILLFREGEPANAFYLIESGAIALEAHVPSKGPVVVQRLGSGEVLGWSWLFPPFTWHFHARALERTSVIVLSGAHLLITAEHNSEFGYALLKRISQIVIHRLQAQRAYWLATLAA